MAAFMPKKLLAPIGGAAFDFQHLVQFEEFEARMRQIEGNGNGRHTFRREPLVTEITIGPKGDFSRAELAVELLDVPIQFAVLDPNAQVADAKRKQFLVL